MADDRPMHLSARTTHPARDHTVTGASDVEILREAAARMRALAEAVDGWWDGSEGLLSPLEPEDRAHMAAWDPKVALAVADWLDMCAGMVANYGPNAESPWVKPHTQMALSVARAFLGTTP